MHCSLHLFHHVYGARDNFASLSSDQAPNGTLYRIVDRADLEYIVTALKIDYHDFNQHGPGIYLLYVETNCNSACPRKSLLCLHDAQKER